MFNKRMTIGLLITLLLSSIESAAANPRLVETNAAGNAAYLRNENIGVIKVKSANSFTETVAKLEAAIKANSALKIVATIDHSANAKATAQELRPTVLIIFGNPRMGTPLMQDSQTAALDLPQKIIVFEDEKGSTFVAYNDPVFIAKRHGIAKDHPAVKTAATGLASLAKIASTK
jgi:uncharacterized protein (DUF302 family)